MRIGICRSLTNSFAGGIFQYEKVFLRALGEIAARCPEELVYLCYDAKDLDMLVNAGGLNYRGLPIMSLNKAEARQSTPETYRAQVPSTPPPLDPRDPKFNYAGADLLRRNGIDLLVLSSPTLPGFSFRLPFVVPIFDLNHRLQPEFPEVSTFGETNAREHYYVNTCQFATLVLVDSPVGKSDVLRFYGSLIDEDRIRVLPYYPPVEERTLPTPQDLARVRAKYDLPSRYFFYPAQFWPHKNHALIVQAIKLIAEETGEAVPVVFCGAYWTYVMAGNFKEVMALAAKLGVSDRVRYLGSVPDEDMAALYTLSAGLIMPTFFGPTNFPPLEAWHLGRPVITSDINGVREHTGDAGLLVNPRSPQDLAAAMKRLWHDETLCCELVARGKRRLASHSWQSFVDSLTAILAEACERVRTGRTPQYPDFKPDLAAAQQG
jgi:glycosyltransferase involved in cell wall biosynthesis